MCFEAFLYGSSEMPFHCVAKGILKQLLLWNMSDHQRFFYRRHVWCEDKIKSGGSPSGSGGVSCPESSLNFLTFRFTCW